MPVLFIDSGGVVEAVYRDNDASNADLSSYTFNLDIGPASGSRYVVACFAWTEAGPIDSATIGGVAATILEEASGTGANTVRVAMAIALVPTGTTADVVLNLPDPADDASCIVYSVSGISNTTPAGTADSSAAHPTGTLSCDAGGAIIGCAQTVNNPRRAATWTGIAEDVETVSYGFNSTRGFTAAHSNFETAQSSLACTCTFSGASSGGSCGVFVAFNPS